MSKLINYCPNPRNRMLWPSNEKRKRFLKDVMSLRETVFLLMFLLFINKVKLSVF